MFFFFIDLCFEMTVVSLIFELSPIQYDSTIPVRISNADKSLLGLLSLCLQEYIVVSGTSTILLFLGRGEQGNLLPRFFR
jgi:hypothetical protein